MYQFFDSPIHEFFARLEIFRLIIYFPQRTVLLGCSLDHCYDFPVGTKKIPPATTPTIKTLQLGLEFTSEAHSVCGSRVSTLHDICTISFKVSLIIL